MKEYIILTDSSCDLPANIVKELGIEVIPLSVTVENNTYLNYPDGRDIGFKEFYDLLREKKTAVTSAINLEGAMSAMRPHLEAGRDILYMAFSAALSSTCSAAVMAAVELKEEFPERKILVIDTMCASLGQGLLVYLTALEKKKGCTIEQALAFAEKTRPNLAHWFTVDDLGHLKRGGRVSAATAVVGSVLNIKPVMHVDYQGRLINVDKARGRKNSIRAMLDKMKATAIDPANQTVFISHGDCLEDAEFLAGLIRQEWGVKDIVINYVGPVIGAHTGPGVLALFFLGTER